MHLHASLAAIALCAAAVPAGSDPLEGWFLAGSAPADYTVSADRTSCHSGTTSALLASRSDSPAGFGTLMQEMQAASFKGTRLEFTAHVRADNVRDWAGLWLRVDGSGQSPLAFDNMSDRPIKGSSNWRPYSIVVDVPPDATAIAFGLLLHGAGKVWLDSGSFAVVGPSVPATGVSTSRVLPAPFNLDFEQ